MNINRKCERLQRRIDSMEIRIAELAKENEALRSENRELLYKQSQCNSKLESVSEMRDEYFKLISGLNEIKSKYQQAIFDANKLKKDYAKQFKPIIKQLRTHV